MKTKEGHEISEPKMDSSLDEVVMNDYDVVLFDILIYVSRSAVVSGTLLAYLKVCIYIARKRVLCLAAEYRESSPGIAQLESPT